MASLNLNPFAVLHETAGGEDGELFVPIALKAEKTPGNKMNINQQKPQSSVADQSRNNRVPSRFGSGRSENGRGGMCRGLANGNGFHWLDNRQNGAPQTNNEKGNGGLDNGQRDVNKQYGGNGYGYRQNRHGNGYHKMNRESDTHQQNNDGGGSTHYRRLRGSDFTGYEVSAKKQQELHVRGGNRREGQKINEDRVLEANQRVKILGQEKLAEGDSFQEEDQSQLQNGEGGWNFVGKRRGSGGRGGRSGNGSWRTQLSSGFGATKWGKDEASVHKPKESHNGESREEKTEISSNAEQGNGERILKRNESEELIKKEKKVEASKMTLAEYEKQLIEKRKALEALKPQERKVTLDKDFELMQLVCRKKEDFAAKLNSERENTEEEERIEKVQLKKEERPHEQREKVKSVSMDVYLKVFKRNDRVGYRRDLERKYGSEHDQEHHRYSGGYSRNMVKEAPNANAAGGKIIIPTKAAHEIINVQDSEHFPSLSAVAKA